MDHEQASEIRRRVMNRRMAETQLVAPENTQLDAIAEDYMRARRLEAEAIEAASLDALPEPTQNK